MAEDHKNYRETAESLLKFAAKLDDRAASATLLEGAIHATLHVADRLDTAEKAVTALRKAVENAAARNGNR